MAVRIVHSSIASAIGTGTWYLKSDGTFTTAASDPATWLRRDDREATFIAGDMEGGTTTLVLEQSDDALNVKLTSADLRPSIGAGVVVETPFPYVRVKLTQSVAGTTSAFVFVD